MSAYGRVDINPAALLSQRFRTFLDNADFTLKKQIIQLLAHRIIVSHQSVHVELKIEKPQPQEANAVVAGQATRGQAPAVDPERNVPFDSLRSLRVSFS